MRIRQVTRSNTLDDLEYTWELDPKFDTVSSRSELMRRVNAKEPGAYTYRVVVSDSRGNETILEDELIYKEPVPYSIVQRKYYSNNEMRDPLQVNISPRISGGHPRGLSAVARAQPE